jgi:hypothetical protein
MVAPVDDDRNEPLTVMLVRSSDIDERRGVFRGEVGRRTFEIAPVERNQKAQQLHVAK